MDIDDILSRKFVEIFQGEMESLREFNQDWINICREARGARPIDWNKYEV